MTASKTSRLSLMKPVGSDAFVTADFTDTFNILDANPGIPVVANAAGRPTNYTAAQHGSRVYQADLNIEWAWNQPTSGSAGSWRRIGNVGLLGSSTASGLISTTTTTYTSGPTASQLTVTVPGGRPIQVAISWDTLGNTYEKSVVQYYENNVAIFYKVFGGKLDPAATAASFTFARDPAPTTSVSLTAKFSIASFNAAPSNGGGTTRINGAQITIWET